MVTLVTKETPDKMKTVQMERKITCYLHLWQNFTTYK